MIRDSVTKDELKKNGGVAGSKANRNTRVRWNLLELWLAAPPVVGYHTHVVSSCYSPECVFSVPDQLERLTCGSCSAAYVVVFVVKFDSHPLPVDGGHSTASAPAQRDRDDAVDVRQHDGYANAYDAQVNTHVTFCTG